MKYRVTQKLMAMGGDYIVEGESGEEAYYFDGLVWSFGGKKVVVYDRRKNEVARLARKMFSFAPNFRVYRNGSRIATIRKRQLTFRDQFLIEPSDGTKYQVIGDYVGHEYTVKRGSDSIARVSKKFFGATDSYGVDIAGGDPLLILSAVVVIDMVLFKNLKSTDKSKF